MSANVAQPNVKAVGAGRLRFDQWYRNWRVFARNRASIVGVAILVFLVGIAVFGPMLAPYHPVSVDAGPPMSPPRFANWFGTDALGRDVLTRAIFGLRVTLFIGFSAAIATTLIGILIGSVAGFFGGLVDDALMRATEVFQVIPRFFLAILMVAFFGSHILLIVATIAVLSWTSTARLVRAEFLSLKSRQFVDAARLAGAGNLSLILTEVLPNAMGVIVANTTLLVGEAMLLEAALSYLGLGDPTQTSLGQLLHDAQYVVRSAWWAMTFPGLGLFLAVLSATLLGDGLNDVFDPRTRER